MQWLLQQAATVEAEFSAYSASELIEPGSILTDSRFWRSRQEQKVGGPVTGSSMQLHSSITALPRPCFSNAPRQRLLKARGQSTWKEART